MELTYHFKVTRLEAGYNGRANITLQVFDPTMQGTIDQAGLWLQGVAPEGEVRLHDVVTVVLTVPDTWEEIL